MLRGKIVDYATSSASRRVSQLAASRMGAFGTAMQRKAMSTAAEDLELLETLMAKAKARADADKKAEAAANAAAGPRFQIQTFNAISPIGLKAFPDRAFVMTGSSGPVPDGVDEEPHAVLLRSHKLQGDEVQSSVRAIARCGAGTNNIPIPDMTARGIPVFNTPGANANAVKELVITSLLLASRGIIEGIDHTKTKIVPEEGEHKKIAARIEKDKKHFVGQEIAGKTLAVAGLGNIGAMVAEAALALGMNVVGYDPKISVDAAWRLPNSVTKMASLEDMFAAADYVSINMPYIKDATHGIINESVLSKMKPNCHILNMARGEIVDGAALKAKYASGHTGKYICDFADEAMQNHPNFICIPHLGASTAEAEDNCAKMAAEQIINYLETGTIKNAVNFPAAQLDRQGDGTTRLCVINNNKPGVLADITNIISAENVNIAQQLNTSRESIAYNVIDMDSLSPEASKTIQEKIHAIDGVLSTRIIWEGTASEGPSSFMTKA